MARYLLNLSGDFDTGNLLPLFLPHLADGNLSLFEEITRSPLPEASQEKEILRRLNIINRHFTNNRLCADSDPDSVKIGIIIGFEEWRFTGFGQLSRLPVYKIRYLRDKCKDVFKKFYNNIIFNYYITGLKSKPYIGILNHIEQTGYLPETNDLPGELIRFGWLRHCDISDCLPGNPKNHKVIDESSDLTPEMKSAIANFIKAISDKINTSFNSLGFQIDKEKNNFISGFAHCFHHIKDIQDFFESDFVKITDSFIKNQLSLSKSLSGKEIAFRYFLDEANVSKNLYSKIAFAGLIIESLLNDLFEKSGPRSFRKIAAIDIDPESFSKYIAELISLIDHNTEQLIRKDMVDPISYKHFHLSDEDITRRYPELHSKDYFDFKSHDNIKKIIGSYFDVHKRKKVREALAEKDIRFLEQKIFSKINEAFYTPDYSDIGYTEESDNIQNIKTTLLNLTGRLPRLTSKIDHDAYMKPKYDLYPLISKKREDLINKISLLPRLKTVFLLPALGSLAIFLLAFPLYRFNYPINALIITSVFLALSVAAIPIAGYITKRKINVLLMDLDIANEKLFRLLEHFRKQIIEAAIEYKTTVIHRKNIETLQKICDQYDDENQKKHEYKVFLDNLKKILVEYPGNPDKYSTVKKHARTINDFNVPPYRNEIFKRKEIDRGPVRIIFQHPHQEPDEVDYPVSTFIKRIEFE